jgi:hypothetical protein
MTYLIAAITVVALLDGPTQQLGPAITIPPNYRSSVAAMLRYSPTFRRQCNRIARTPDLRVEIVSSLLGGAPGGALTRIVRSARGIDASVQLAPAGDPVVLIAHEFEHILEQLDGVDLPVMATRVATGVHLVPGSGHFETDRAIAAGRQVADEVRRGRARDGS